MRISSHLYLNNGNGNTKNVTAMFLQVNKTKNEVSNNVVMCRKETQTFSDQSPRN